MWPTINVAEIPFTSKYSDFFIDNPIYHRPLRLHQQHNTCNSAPLLTNAIYTPLQHIHLAMQYILHCSTFTYQCNIRYITAHSLTNAIYATLQHIHLAIQYILHCSTFTYQCNICYTAAHSLSNAIYTTLQHLHLPMQYILHCSTFT